MAYKVVIHAEAESEIATAFSYLSERCWALKYPAGVTKPAFAG
jgi:hypothetical protein